jgi:hypothetical protein
MIEELQTLINLLGDLSHLAVYVLVGFVVFKLVIYLATTGTIVYLVSLAINRLYEYFTHKRNIVDTIEMSKKIKDISITTDGTSERLLHLLKTHVRSPSLSYITERNVDWLEEAIMEKKERDEKQQKEWEKAKTDVHTFK